jgi:hypothetical protein
MAPNGVLKRYTGYRPTVSDRGPPITGPRPRAKTYIDRGRIACVVLTPNSSRNWATEELGRDVPMDLHRVRRMASSVVIKPAGNGPDLDSWPTQ